MKPGPIRDYECPRCEEWVAILPSTNTKDFNCPWCEARLMLVEDAEFANGRWHDLSTLVEYPKEAA